ncbi:DNA-binding protein [Desulfoluna limicola]|uniref:DNA-binding protein n=1 Tax=Desulfoluna limicola TaxID=2810562 RepID=A0ABM7PP77_9BACT|nr:cupin domain-containing protein [Desulfoluna limicola]BCS99088.1 DNA-binding protein [Desulfoluna limicola]
MKIEKIGSRIAGLMEQRGVSLDELVERTGLQRDFLKNIGDEKEYFPSLGPLLKISRALGVRLGTLLDDQVSEDPLIVRKDDDKKEIDMLPDKDKPVALKFYSLGRGKTDRHMEPFFIEILPESAQEKKLSSHEGEEFIVVTEGEVEVIYGAETHLLKTGDSIYYNSVVPHYVSCASETKACIYAVLYIPE